MDQDEAADNLGCIRSEGMLTRPFSGIKGFKLEAIAVFQDLGKQDSIRTVQVYSQEGQYMALQQGFALLASAYFPLHEPVGMFFSSEAESLRFMARQKADQEWTCILDYADYLPPPPTLAPLLSPKTNPLLKLLPTLISDLTYVETAVEIARLNGQVTNASLASSGSFATGGYGNQWSPQSDVPDDFMLPSPSLGSSPEMLSSNSYSLQQQAPFNTTQASPRTEFLTAFWQTAASFPASSSGLTPSLPASGDAQTFTDYQVRPENETHNFLGTKSPAQRKYGGSKEILMQGCGPAMYVSIPNSKPKTPKFSERSSSHSSVDTCHSGLSHDVMRVRSADVDVESLQASMNRGAKRIMSCRASFPPTAHDFDSALLSLYQAEQESKLNRRNSDPVKRLDEPAVSSFARVLLEPSLHHKTAGSPPNVQVATARYPFSPKPIIGFNSKPVLSGRPTGLVSSGVARFRISEPSRYRPPEAFRGPLKRASKLTVEDLNPYFDMPMADACKALGVGATVLKRRCRELDIPRWPYRKVKSIDGLIRTIQELGPSDGSASKQVEDALRRLVSEKQRIAETPSLGMAQETKKFRQACFKASHKIRKSGASL